jgi:3D (Asp-Asp-Asp) domain-containing protein
MKILNLIATLLALSSLAHADTVTAYCACQKCCGKNAKGITASGKKPMQGVTVAASRNLPIGTRIFIEGVGVRVVQDRLAKKYDNRFDVFFTSHSEALKFGKRELKVRTIK